MTLHTPTTEPEACQVVADAAGRRTPLTLQGGGTKTDLGRPAQAEANLSSAGLTGVTLYEPAELVIGARAGTPLREVVATLAERGQELSFEPMDHRVLLGTTGEPTIGAVAAGNISGPRRILSGAARDSLIGVRFVNGRAEAIKSGGRVMKNVTGLDLVKLMAGSWGTLGFLTEVTFKVQPRPERIATLSLPGLSDARAVEALCTAAASPFEVTGAAHLPGERTLIRIEGFSTAIDYRLGQLRRVLKGFGTPDVIEGEAAADLWRGIRDGAPLAEPRDRAVWRISTAPTMGPGLVEAIAGALDARWYYDWSGGLIWLSTPATGDAGAAAIRAAVARAGGHATLIRAPMEVRAAVDVFQPLSEPLMRVSMGIKASLDPAGVFNPGRMHAGV
ncbi:glycolate oxidase subunit GlcE [Salinarimonas soli]|uniref:Glycolate oxidase subunit GlcE n=1 Tax=Salinarimonas soli TaxID=1638099 RepID=A0A5B2VCA1_9HYPH|nr:glycolate oxidase subunit GlcE [Salinarimonas soli]KAA2236366.1 glycolate oxidase subunit GlcE [Salinarimonas soli]